jgi:hypothetical protein
MPGDMPSCRKHIHLPVINISAYRRFQTGVSKGLLLTNPKMQNVKSCLVIINLILN